MSIDPFKMFSSDLTRQQLELKLKNTYTLIWALMDELKTSIDLYRKTDCNKLKGAILERQKQIRLELSKLSRLNHKTYWYLVTGHFKK